MIGGNDDSISVAVVENHQHALYHIHRKLRTNNMLGKSWSMLHFDAHADLACPGKHIPAIACFRPNDSFPHNSAKDDGSDNVDGDNLYDGLDASASGIAEWILPLVLAADLRSVLWVRPHHGISIPIGRHEFHVGVTGLKSGCAGQKYCASFVDLPADGVVKVDSKVLYYVEDESYVPTDKLLLPQLLCLNVCEDDNSLEESIPDDLSKPFLLDICLDYFCCRNPFLFDLEVMGRNASRVILDALSSSVIYNGSWSQFEPESLLQQIRLFRTNLDAALKLTAQDEPPSSSCILSLMGSFYESELEASRISKELASLHPLGDDFVSLASEALPYLLLPHDDFASDEKRRQEEVEKRIANFRRVLQYYILQSTHRPFLITIARSSDDGFTPNTVVDQLQSRVLEVLRDEIPSCCLDVHIDYDV